MSAEQGVAARWFLVTVTVTRQYEVCAGDSLVAEDIGMRRAMAEIGSVRGADVDVKRLRTQVVR
jgi:hypothetical protein